MHGLPFRLSLSLSPVCACFVGSISWLDCIHGKVSHTPDHALYCLGSAWLGVAWQVIPGSHRWSEERVAALYAELGAGDRSRRLALYKQVALVARLLIPTHQLAK